jgi:uncharacterized damage-inducible protein DinB
MKEKLIAEFEESTRNLLATLTSFSEQEFNRVPFEGSWSIGQVAEHLLKPESSIPGIFKGNSIQTEREPFEKTGVIESIFLDYTIKMQSPEFTLPSGEQKNKQQLIKEFAGNRKELQGLMETMDLDRTFTDFPFPQLGEFTGWEWICFAVCHTKRHIRQMKSIAEKLKMTPGNAA